MEKNINIAIITSGYFPLPPVKGGAIEALVEEIIEEYNPGDAGLTIYSVYDPEAEMEKNTNGFNCISYIKIPRLIQIFDKISYFIVKNILKKKKHMSYRYIFQRLYFIDQIAKELNANNFTDVIFENHPTLLKSLDKYNNSEKYEGHYYYHAHNEITNDFGETRNLINVKKFICVSKYIGNTILQRYSSISKDKITVLRNRVDETRFKNVSDDEIANFKEKYHIDSHDMVFTFSGRLNREKGVRELISAFKKANIQNAKLIVAGSYYFGLNIRSNYEDEILEEAEPIKEKVIFTGNIPYSEMPVLYALSDVVVLPSIWNDPAPLTVIESLTCAKPLITTISGGIPEYANSDNSILVPVDEKLVDNISQAMQTLANDQKRRLRLSENAKMDAKYWTKEGYYKDLISIIRDDKK